MLENASEGLTAVAITAMLAMFLPFGPATAAPAAKPPAVNAEFLKDPANWPAGALILDIADPAVLDATPAIEVKLLSTNRCFANIPAGEDGKPSVTLPPGFTPAAGTPPSEIYNNIVNQDFAVFLAAVRSPLADPSVADFDCYKLTFAYKAKPPAAAKP